MTDLPACVRCGHPFARHRSWDSCLQCPCRGYLKVEPIVPSAVAVGEVYRLAGAGMGGVVTPARGCTVTSNDAERRVITVQIEDGAVRTIEWELARTGGLQRL